VQCTALTRIAVPLPAGPLLEHGACRHLNCPEICPATHAQTVFSLHTVSRTKSVGRTKSSCPVNPWPKQSSLKQHHDKVHASMVMRRYLGYCTCMQTSISCPRSLLHSGMVS